MAKISAGCCRLGLILGVTLSLLAEFARAEEALTWPGISLAESVPVWTRVPVVYSSVPGDSAQEWEDKPFASYLAFSPYSTPISIKFVVPGKEKHNPPNMSRLVQLGAVRIVESFADGSSRLYDSPWENLGQTWGDTVAESLFGLSNRHAQIANHASRHARNDYITHPALQNPFVTGEAASWKPDSAQVTRTPSAGLSTPTCPGCPAATVCAPAATCPPQVAVIHNPFVAQNAGECSACPATPPELTDIPGPLGVLPCPAPIAATECVGMIAACEGCIGEVDPLTAIGVSADPSCAANPQAGSWSTETNWIAEHGPRDLLITQHHNIPLDHAIPAPLLESSPVATAPLSTNAVLPSAGDPITATSAPQELPVPPEMAAELSGTDIALVQSIHRALRHDIYAQAPLLHPDHPAGELILPGSMSQVEKTSSNSTALLGVIADHDDDCPGSGRTDIRQVTCEVGQECVCPPGVACGQCPASGTCTQQSQCAQQGNCHQQGQCTQQNLCAQQATCTPSAQCVQQSQSPQPEIFTESDICGFTTRQSAMTNSQCATGNCPSGTCISSGVYFEQEDCTSEPGEPIAVPGGGCGTHLPDTLYGCPPPVAPSPAIVGGPQPPQAFDPFRNGNTPVPFAPSQLGQPGEQVYSQPMMGGGTAEIPCLPPAPPQTMAQPAMPRFPAAAPYATPPVLDPLPPTYIAAPVFGTPPTFTYSTQPVYSANPNGGEHPGQAAELTVVYRQLDQLAERMEDLQRYADADRLRAMAAEYRQQVRMLGQRGNATAAHWGVGPTPTPPGMHPAY
ncbi:MAG: hypothetical protein SFX18_01990 [Pirellulales bacterium]|nr:hypothetical protein [Pirellulales bacterium]